MHRHNNLQPKPRPKGDPKPKPAPKGKPRAWRTRAASSLARHSRFDAVRAAVRRRGGRIGVGVGVGVGKPGKGRQ